MHSTSVMDTPKERHLAPQDHIIRRNEDWIREDFPEEKEA